MLGPANESDGTVFLLLALPLFFFPVLTRTPNFLVLCSHQKKKEKKVLTKMQEFVMEGKRKRRMNERRREPIVDGGHVAGEKTQMLPTSLWCIFNVHFEKLERQR